MHCLLTYGLTGSPAEQARLNAEIAAVVKRNPHVQVLGNTYVIKVNSDAEATQLLNAIVGVARTAPNSMNFIVTPIISGGRYNGWLPQSLWTQINSVTSP